MTGSVVFNNTILLT